MDKTEAIMRYRAAMTVFKGWRDSGLITDEELLAIDTKLAAKYGLSSCSIYRDYGLIKPKIRAIYGNAKGEADGENC